MKLTVGFLVAVAFSSLTSFAGQMPDCLDERGRDLPLMNSTVIEWKSSTNSGFKSRAHVEGVVGEIYGEVGPAQSGGASHDHFQLTLDEDHSVEVIFNNEFGKALTVRKGAKVEVCGDFINSSKQNGRYPPSPDGAIIHWVHRSPDLSRHQDGYIIMDGVLYGF